MPVNSPRNSDVAFLRDAQQHFRTLPAEFPIVRGVYSTMYSFWGDRWERMLGHIRDTELNAIVIDVKDDKGQLAWHMPDIPMAMQGGGADWTSATRDPRPRLRQLRDLGGYPIARVVCFKDSYVAQAVPDLAVKDTRNGAPWQGRDGQYWLNPYRDEAWQYCIDVGKQAAAMGFLEVQFDYVRFPNGGDGPADFFSFPGVPDGTPREQWRHPDQITEFLASAREQLHEVGVRVSADVFGLTTYNYSWNGDGTGQVWERLAAELDYISPMVYPSHYGAGNYGLDPHPVRFPYETVKGAMEEAQVRSQGLRAKIRPWLEDFGSPWLGALSPAHTPARLQDQFRAVYEKGIDSWLIWNASNVFSLEALAPTTQARAEPWVRDPSQVNGANGEILQLDTGTLQPPTPTPTDSSPEDS